MDWMKGEYSKLISFVSAGSEDKSNKKTKKRKIEGNLDGQDVRNFYEEVISEQNPGTQNNWHSSVGVTEQLPERICSQKHNPTSTVQRKRSEEYSEISTLDISRYLRYAQEGNLKQMKMFLDKGVPVDSPDSFGWTALMCAAHSGQFEVVKYLLSLGSNTKIVNAKYQNVLQIARAAGYRKISTIIEKSEMEIFQEDILSENSDEHQDTKPFYCKVCKCKFKESSVKSHEASTVHIFNAKKKAKDDPFLLPSSNKGYKMMLRSGWDGQKGLGSEGQGQKYPVKTVLKRDRKCLGSEKDKKPKITHFNAYDKTAVIRNPERKLTNRTMNKRAQKTKERKQKQWERNLRTSMSLDL